MELIFHQGVSGCAAMPEQSATIQCDEGAITFEGSVLTPNPCHYLKARLDVADQSSVDIVITASPQSGEGGYCIECVGEISFNGSVELSGACSSVVSIVYDGVVIGEYERK